MSLTTVFCVTILQALAAEAYRVPCFTPRLGDLCQNKVILSKPVIRNDHIPNCKNCYYFERHELNKDNFDLGRCRMYGEKDIVSGEITYEYAVHCRKNDAQCGKEGIHFVEKEKMD